MPVGGIFYLLGTPTFYAKKNQVNILSGRRSVYTYCVCVLWWVGGAEDGQLIEFNTARRKDWKMICSNCKRWYLCIYSYIHV